MTSSTRIVSVSRRRERRYISERRLRLTAHTLCRLTLSLHPQQCIALISSTNSPLYVRSFGPSDKRGEADLRYHFIAHSALDLVEERETAKNVENYFGLLMTMEDLAV